MGSDERQGRFYCSSVYLRLPTAMQAAGSPSPNGSPSEAPPSSYSVRIRRTWFCFCVIRSGFEIGWREGREGYRLELCDRGRIGSRRAIERSNPLVTSRLHGNKLNLQTCCPSPGDTALGQLRSCCCPVVWLSKLDTYIRVQYRVYQPSLRAILLKVHSTYARNHQVTTEESRSVYRVQSTYMPNSPPSLRSGPIASSSKRHM